MIMTNIPAKYRTLCHKHMVFLLLGSNATDTVYTLRDESSVNGETPIYDIMINGYNRKYIKLNCFRRHALKTLQTEYPNIYEKELEVIYNKFFNK